MIVIIGETHDDILYFDSVIANRKEETILGKYKVSVGTIFSQEALVIDGLYTSTLSSSILMNILDNYYVDLVISVGRCMSVSNKIKDGDIVVSKKVIDANVDLSMYSNVAIGEINGFKREFDVQDDILGYLSKGLERRISVDYHHAVFLSTDNMSKQMTDVLKERQSVFGLENELLVIDQNSAGIAVASTLKETPFIAIKVVENKLSEINNLETYSTVLSKYIDLGKAVISTINDISRSDILEGE